MKRLERASLEDVFTREKTKFNEKYSGHSEIWPEYPSIAFEGPMGMSWSCKDVPDISLLKALREILGELKNRNFDVKEFIDSTKMPEEAHGLVLHAKIELQFANGSYSCEVSSVEAFERHIIPLLDGQLRQIVIPHKLNIPL